MTFQNSSTSTSTSTFVLGEGAKVWVAPWFHTPLTPTGGCRATQETRKVQGTVVRWLVRGEVPLVSFDEYRLPECAPDCESGAPKDRAAFPVDEMELVDRPAPGGGSPLPAVLP